MTERDWRKDREMCEKATAGPWFVYRTVSAGLTVQCAPGWVCVMSAKGDEGTAEFIAQAREALPYWLQRVKELEERLKAVEGRKCKTCSWWVAKEYLPGWGTCLRADSVAGVAVHPESLFVAQDAESYHAWLDTRPDFGCVCWEARK